MPAPQSIGRPPIESLDVSDRVIGYLIDRMECAALIVRDDSTIVRVNAAACSLLELGSSDLVGQAIEHFFVRSDRQPINLQLVIARGRELSFESIELLQCEQSLGTRPISFKLAPIANTREALLLVDAKPHANTNRPTSVGPALPSDSADEALHETYTLLSIALENAQQGIWDWSPTTDVLSQSGYLPDREQTQLIMSVDSGIGMAELIHPDDRASSAEALAAYFRGDAAIYSVECRVRSSGDKYRTLLIRGQAIERQGDGRIGRMLGTYTDISDINSQHQRLELALENGRQGLWEWRPEPDIIEFSDSWHSLYGYDREELGNVRTEVSSRIHEADRDIARRALVELLKGERTNYTIEYRFRCKDGDYLWIMERCSVAERDAQGQAILVLGTHVDISSQKSTERELMESRRFLELILDTIPDSVYWKDTACRYLGANRQFALTAGLRDPSEVVGRTDEEFLWGQHAANLRADDRGVMASGKKKLHIEQGFSDANGNNLVFETTKAPLLDETGTTIGVLGVSREITIQRQNEKQLEKFAESITVSGGGGRLLDTLTKAAVELAGAKIAFIATLNCEDERATIVSAYPMDSELRERAFQIVDTPCSEVLDNDLCIYSGNVQARFPNDRPLLDMGVKSYVGKRLLDGNDRPIGVFALLDCEPLKDEKFATSVLDIIATSAAPELQREQREHALRESEQRYRTTYDNVPVMICTIGDNHLITDVNNAWINATGFDNSETVGTKLPSYLTPNSRDTYHALLQADIEHPSISDVQLEFVSKAGAIITVALSAVRTVGADGAPMIVTVLEDITRQLLAAQQMRLAATAFETHEALVIRDAEQRILRVNNAFKAITGYAESDILGAQPAYLTNPEGEHAEESLVWQAVEEHGKWDGERMNVRADGTIYSAWQTITAVSDDSGAITHYVENFTDVSELKQALEDAERLALYDPLTALPNRRYLIEQLEASISLSRRHGTTGALLFIDLDQFKNINDSLGHATGDALLIQVAKRLSRLMRKEDTIARLGGDEFVVVLAELDRDPKKSVDQAQRVAEKIHLELGKSYELDNHVFNVTPTIGVTLFPDEGKTVEDILQEADSAMYQGKADGRNLTKFFHPRMQTEAQMRIGLERDLRTATERDELTLFFQPQYNTDGAMFAAEALLRWNHPSRGLVLPGEFIPIAEESGLIIDIGRWVFAQALESLRGWTDRGAPALDHLSINVSSRQFRSASFVADMVHDLEQAGVPPEQIVLEVTEGTVIQNFDETARKMEALRDIGIRFAIDDFGIGYSSLSYLSRLPLDQLKIDRSFVTDVLADPSDAIITKTIIGMGRNLHLQTIAEGVETRAQLEFLKGSGCDGFQGFLLAKPLPEAEFLALDRQWSGEPGPTEI